MHQQVYYATLLTLGLLTAGFAQGTELSKTSGKLPPLPGKAPVFARITKVDPEKGTFNFILLFDEIVNTETIVTDGQGKTLKQSSNRVMTSRVEEKTDRPLKGSIVSTGEGLIILMNQAQEKLAGKLVIMCDDFDGLHPVYREMLAKDTWVIESEKSGGLRKSEKHSAVKDEIPGK